MTHSNFNQIKAPSYFQCPNELVDHWLPFLKETELKVLLVIIRKTFGWNKKRDRISNSQLAQITGLAIDKAREAAKSLADKGVILRETFGNPGQQETYYELVIIEDSNNNYQEPKAPGGGSKFPPGGEQIAPHNIHLLKRHLMKDIIMASLESMIVCMVLMMLMELIKNKKKR